jgi:hypothetical protein
LPLERIERIRLVKTDRLELTPENCMSIPHFSRQVIFIELRRESLGRFQRMLPLSASARKLTADAALRIPLFLQVTPEEKEVAYRLINEYTLAHWNE